MAVVVGSAVVLSISTLNVSSSLVLSADEFWLPLLFVPLEGTLLLSIRSLSGSSLEQAVSEMIDAVSIAENKIFFITFMF